MMRRKEQRRRVRKERRKGKTYARGKAEAVRVLMGDGSTEGIHWGSRKANMSPERRWDELTLMRCGLCGH